MITEMHFQGVRDDGDALEKLLSLERPFIASLVPIFMDKSLKNNGKNVLERVYSEEQYYPPWFVGALRKIGKNPNIIWAQEGMFHYCEPCFEEFEKNGGRKNNSAPDPFHEHLCVSNWKGQNLEEQLKSIKEGKTLISDLTGIVPRVYCPPNHLHNKETLLAARNLGFKYFNVRNFMNLQAYNEDGLTILPEAKIGEMHNETSPVIYTYYGNLIDDFESHSEMLDKSEKGFKIREKPEFKAAVNQVAVQGYKKLRDWKKRFG
ncbi:hypothetical protein HY449_02160 [Candidatus Pacearchaeota archaeon]|nr:hypothetical protein [Candidatus Pacearchaeota archaeon]